MLSRYGQKKTVDVMGHAPRSFCKNNKNDAKKNIQPQPAKWLKGVVAKIAIRRQMHFSLSTTMIKMINCCLRT